MLGVRFVDRADELGALFGLAERGSGVPVYLYGPEGCGKTRLLREFAGRLSGREGYLVIYIDALEERDPGRAIYGSEELRRLLVEAARGASGPLGAVLAYAVTRVLAGIEKRLVRGKHVVVVVDDVARPIGLDSVEAYVKSLLRLLEYDLAEKEPASALLVASTSEGLSLERLRRHPTWLSLRLLWGLPRDGFEELASLLGAPSRDAVEETWRLTGGNPRALIQIATIYQWSTGAWLHDLGTNVVVPVLARIRAKGLLEELHILLEDPDAAVTRASPRLRRLVRLLTEHNLFIYKAATTLAGKPLPPSPEQGIGEYYAWQLPAYRTLLQERLQAKK